MADVVEADQLELRRSPRAEVSQRVAAIDHDRPNGVEQLWRVAQNILDRNMNRATDMGGLVLMRRQRVHDSRAGRQHPEKFAMLDLAHDLRAHRGQSGEGGIDDRLAAAGCYSSSINFVAALRIRGASRNVSDEIVAVAGDKRLREVRICF